MSATDTVVLPGVSRPFSRIVAGTAGQPFLEGTGTDAILDELADAGVSVFDTARAYLASERSIGSWMARRGNRESVTVITKCGHPTASDWKRVRPDAMRDDLAASLKDLGTDYVDVLLLHRDDPEVEVGPIVDTLNEFRQAGLVKAFGASNWSHERIEQANLYARANGLEPLVVSSPNFGLAEQVEDPWGHGSLSISGPANRAARQWYEEHDVPVLAWAGLGRGLFSGRVVSGDPTRSAEVLDEQARRGYAHPANFERLRRAERLALVKGASVPQIALAWMFAQPFDVMAVVSAANSSRMRENMEALSLDLTSGERDFLDLQVDTLF